MSGRPIHAGAALSIAAFLSMGGCARHSSVRVPQSAKIGATETGIASWYGYPYDGRQAASGEIYDMHQLTAAHRTLPFGTWVEVSDLDDGKKVTVRINDRGPFVRDRIIDLSLAAAQAIDMVGPGSARVRLKIVAAPDPLPDAPPPANSNYAVQTGAFSTRDRAEFFCDSLRAEFPGARVVEGPEVWRVLLGDDLTFDDANQLAAKVRETGRDALVVKEP